MHWTERSCRRPAHNLPMHAHSLTFTTFDRHPFFRSDRTCQWMASAIDAARERLSLDLWAYVFMHDHVHLVVRPRSMTYTVSSFLQRIKEPVGRRAIAHVRKHHPAWLERLAVRHGERTRYRFWREGGGFDRNVEDDATLRAMIEYIHANPVRKDLVADESDRTWSSASFVLRGRQGPLRVDPIPKDWCVG